VPLGLIIYLYRTCKRIIIIESYSTAITSCQSNQSSRIVELRRTSFSSSPHQPQKKILNTAPSKSRTQPLSKNNNATITMMHSALQASRAASRVAPRTAGSSRFMASKILKFGVEGRAAMMKGVDTLADAVQVSHSQLCFLYVPTT
jgi:hypothetical protein